VTKVWTTSIGKLVYNPPRPDIRKSFAHDDWRLVVEVDRGFSLYYNWWVKKMWGLELQLPVWKTHITILNGKQPVDPEFHKIWRKHENERITFEYSVEFEQHWKFFVLPVRCERFHEIRAELGLSTWDKHHITFGRML
jgi:hypothetical protein